MIPEQKIKWVEEQSVLLMRLSLSPLEEVEYHCVRTVCEEANSPTFEGILIEAERKRMLPVREYGVYRGSIILEFEGEH